MADRHLIRTILALGWVYFIQEADHGLIKIGKSSCHPATRRDVLQTGAPQVLTVLAYLQGKQFEGEIHRKFKHLRVRGEWFRPEPDLMQFVAEAKADPWHYLHAKARKRAERGW